MRNYHFGLRKEHFFSYNLVLLSLFISLIMLTSYTTAIIPKTQNNFRILYDSGGQSLCATEFPSLSFSSDQLALAVPANTMQPPGEILCAWKCTNDLNCTCFNWEKEFGQCELYYYTPTTCSYSCGCLHFESTQNHQGSCTINDPIVDLIAPNLCSFPFVYRGSLYYNCTQNVSETVISLGCYATNRTWKTCGQPNDYRVNWTSLNITIPNINVVTPVLSINNWIIFQQRINENLSFQRIWTDYKQGFGNWYGEYWMGLEKIYQLTKSGGWRLRLEIKNATSGLWSDREYDTFSIDSELSKYALHVSLTGFGSEVDVLNIAGQNYQNGMKFTTSDRDNDNYSGNCASIHKAGFWYNACFAINFNGDYSGSFRYVQRDGDPVVQMAGARMLMKSSY